MAARIVRSLGLCGLLVSGWANAELNTRVPYFNGTRFVELDLDPDKVVEVQIMHLGPGQGIATINGHILTRLVICASGHSRLADCRQDFRQNIALSYNGFIDTPSTSIVKGFGIGSYAYERFLKVMPFDVAIQKYTFEEMRNGSSYVLPLNVDEKRRLVMYFLEDFWKRGESFRLLKTNCTTLTTDALKAAAPGRFDSLKAKSPNGLHEELLKKHLVSAEAEMFPSQRSRFEVTFDQIKSITGTLAKNFDSWLALNGAEERHYAYQALLAQKGESARDGIEALETYNEAKMLRQARSQFLAITSRRCKPTSLDPVCAQLEESYLNAGMHVFPNFFLLARHPLNGIPDTGEIDRARFENAPPVGDVAGLPGPPLADHAFESVGYQAARVRLSESRELLNWIKTRTVVVGHTSQKACEALTRLLK